MSVGRSRKSSAKRRRRKRKIRKRTRTKIRTRKTKRRRHCVPRINLEALDAFVVTLEPTLFFVFLDMSMKTTQDLRSSRQHVLNGLVVNCGTTVTLLRIKVQAHACVYFEGTLPGDFPVVMIFTLTCHPCLSSLMALHISETRIRYATFCHASLKLIDVAAQRRSF